MAQIDFKKTIEEIKNKVDIVDVISGYVQLKKRGKNYIGLCPFHSEKTPSFTVSQEKNIFHCFGCGEGGNVFDFIMKTEKIEFIEALKILGDKAGIPIELSGYSQKNKGERNRLYLINQAACKFFEDNLDQNIIDYFEKRGINKESIGNFKIGYAKEGWNNLFNHLVGKGFDPVDIEKSGLIIKKDQGKDYFDRFRKRIMFPIIDKRKRVLGFSGRADGDFEPKYLNSPDSSIFHKGEVVFGFNLAEDSIKKKKYAILVEGNVDVMMCHQHGFANAVAALGTAFTLAQGKLLKRLVGTVVIAFDADNAGIIATERARLQLKQAGIDIRVVDLLDKKDPADFLKDNGANAFLNLLKTSLPGLEYKIRKTIGKYNLTRIESKAKAISEVAQIISLEPNNVIQKEYIKLSSKIIDCDPESLSSEVRRKSFYKNKRRKGGGIIEKPASKLEEAEKQIVKLAFEDKDALQIITKSLDQEDFSNPNLAAIMDKISTSAICQVEELDSETHKSIIRQLLLHSDPIENIKDKKQTIEDCIKTIKRERVKGQLDDIRSKIKKEEANSNFKRIKELQEEFSKLGEIFRSLGR